MSAAPAIQTRDFGARLPELQDVRRFVASVMAGHPAVDDAILAVSELAANAIEHSAAASSAGFTVQVAHLADAVRIEVDDAGGPDQPRLASAPDDATRGRGLFIVDSLSRDWGVAHDSAHTGVWCEIGCGCAHEPALDQLAAA